MDCGQSPSKKDVVDRFLDSNSRSLESVESDSNSLVRASNEQANDLTLTQEEADELFDMMDEIRNRIKALGERRKPATLKYEHERALAPSHKNRSTQTDSWTPPPPTNNGAQSTERGYGTRSPTTSNGLN